MPCRRSTARRKLNSKNNSEGMALAITFIKGVGMSIARMRSINESLALIREADPGTAVTYNLIRRLVANKKVRYFCSGKKVILNYDDLLEVINQQ